MVPNPTVSRVTSLVPKLTALVVQLKATAPLTVLTVPKPMEPPLMVLTVPPLMVLTVPQLMVLTVPLHMVLPQPMAPPLMVPQHTEPMQLLRPMPHLRLTVPLQLMVLIRLTVPLQLTVLIRLMQLLRLTVLLQLMVLIRPMQLLRLTVNKHTLPQFKLLLQAMEVA